MRSHFLITICLWLVFFYLFTFLCPVGRKTSNVFLARWIRQKTNRHLVFGLPNIRRKSVLKLRDLIAPEDNARALLFYFFWFCFVFDLGSKRDWNCQRKMYLLNRSNYYSFVSDIKSGCERIDGVPASFRKRIDALELAAATCITVFEI